MTVITRELLKPLTMGHLGLVGAFIQEAGIIEKIDSRLPRISNNTGHFTHGQVVALIILNGLGYTNPATVYGQHLFRGQGCRGHAGNRIPKAWFNDDVIGRPWMYCTNMV